MVVDLTDREAVSGAVARTVAHFGRIDVVVSNAGSGAQHLELMILGRD